MENRSRKRTDLVDQLPADKRACGSSSEYRPGSSSSSAPTNSISETLDCEMESSSSASVSGRSEGELDKDSAYGSCDSDGIDESEQRHRSHRDFHKNPSYCGQSQGKFKKILSNLAAEAGPSSQLAALTELCDILSFCMEDSLANFSSDSFVPVLVTLAKCVINADVMLLAIRALTYLCDVLPRSSGFLVKHDAVPALCERLMSIEYLDVAEQSLQALEKISRNHPIACLQAGAIMAVLNYIDFFSTSIQRVALSTVANICKKLPSDCSSLVLVAVPTLCNLLQYEDRKLVENVAVCLIRIVECLSHSTEMMDEICKDGLIHQSTHLIALNSRMPLNRSVHTGLIGMLGRLASGSLVAVRTLFELNISSLLRDILASSVVTNGVPYPLHGDAHSNQGHEVLKLLNQLLPPLARDGENIQKVLDKEKILMDQPELLRQFGMDILPVLVQVVSSGANLYVCYGCLSIINKLVCFSPADMLLDLLKSTNISSFLAGVLARKDHHVLISALKITEILIQKLPDTFLASLLKEGAVYAVDALLVPEKNPQTMVQSSSNIHQSTSTNHKIPAKDALKCLCYAFDVEGSSLSSEMETCKLETNIVHTLARHIKATYFARESQNSEIGLTEILQKLRTFCALLTDNVKTSTNGDICAEHEEYLSHILDQMLAELNGSDPMSTFEFVESGIVKSLVNYLSNGKYLNGKLDHYGLSNHFYVVVRRFEMFAKVLFSSMSQHWEDMPLTLLVRKLQSALSSLDHFPVILSHVSKPRNVYANIPAGRCTMHPCLKVRFVKEEGETVLCDYSSDVLTVEPSTSLDAIEGFLWPKVSARQIDADVKSASHPVSQSKNLTSLLPAICAGPQYSAMDGKAIIENTVDLNSFSAKAKENSVLGSKCEGAKGPQDKDEKFIEESDLISSGLSKMLANEADNFGSASKGKVDIIQHISGESSEYLAQNHPGPTKQELHLLPEVDNSMKTSDSLNATTSNIISTKCRKCSASCEKEDVPPKLFFYVEGKQLDRASTLYQAILQQQVNAEQEILVGSRFWNEIYKVTYKRAAEPNQSICQECLNASHFSSTWNSLGTSWQKLPFFSSMLVAELPCNLEKSNRTYDILLLLKVLEGLNRFRFHLLSCQRGAAFADGRMDNFDDLRVIAPEVLQAEFISSKLTEKLEQQMQDSLAVTISGMPLWCSQLMAACPFLFSFEAKWKYFHLTVFGLSAIQPYSGQQGTSNNSNIPSDRRPHASGLPRKKFQVYRSHILDSAAQMMDLYARQKAVLEVEYNEEVGTGLGPTMEFYTLVSHEFQKVGLGMWREDHRSSLPQLYLGKSSLVDDSEFVVAPLGLFPRPWSAASNSSNGIQFSEVLKKFVLLGQVVAKALQDGRVLDLPLSKAFYKLILDQELDIYDIQSFDPELGSTLLEFQALASRKRFLESDSGKNTCISDLSFRTTRIEDLYLDFTLPGYSDYMLISGRNNEMVNIINLEEYVSLAVDATVRSGIFRQVEAFKFGFNQVFPLKTLQIFTEEELERLLCGERDAWISGELLDDIKFDHGYTASSPSIISLLEIIQEFEREQRRAFLQFVTGAPRLPPGGLAALNPKLTIVRKHSSESADRDLPSVMTCANYLKLPPYSSKERMRERLLYAITEGQGSFHLS